VTGWAPESKAKQRALIGRWSPWKKSTGSKTPEGKARAAGNADKGGTWQLRLLARALREQRKALRRLT